MTNVRVLRSLSFFSFFFLYAGATLAGCGDSADLRDDAAPEMHGESDGAVEPDDSDDVGSDDGGTSSSDAGAHFDAEAAAQADADIARTFNSLDSAVDASTRSDASEVPLAPIPSALQAVGLNLRNVGGGPYPMPVLLFKDGSACVDINLFVDAVDLDDHRAQNPKSWTQWRDVGGKRELKQGETWRALSWPTEYPPLPSGTRLDGTFVSKSGFAVAGLPTSLSQNTYAFMSDGRFAQGQSGGVTSAAVAVGSTQPSHRGKYEIDGYVMTLRYDDGTSARAGFIYAPDAGTPLWLGSGPPFLREEP